MLSVTHIAKSRRRQALFTNGFVMVVVPIPNAAVGKRLLLLIVMEGGRRGKSPEAIVHRSVALSKFARQLSMEVNVPFPTATHPAVTSNVLRT